MLHVVLTLSNENSQIFCYENQRYKSSKMPLVPVDVESMSNVCIVWGSNWQQNERKSTWPFSFFLWSMQHKYSYVLRHKTGDTQSMTVMIRQLISRCLFYNT